MSKKRGTGFSPYIWLQLCAVKLFSKLNFFIHSSMKLGPKFPLATEPKYSFDGEGFTAFYDWTIPVDKDGKFVKS